MKRRNNTDWHESEVQALLQLQRDKRPCWYIAGYLGRSKLACVKKAAEFGLELLGAPDGEALSRRGPSKRTRPCLRCRTPFKSEGPHHRMCSSCRLLSLSPFDVPAAVVPR